MMERGSGYSIFELSPLIFWTLAGPKMALGRSCRTLAGIALARPALAGVALAGLALRCLQNQTNIRLRIDFQLPRYVD